MAVVDLAVAAIEQLRPFNGDNPSISGTRMPRIAALPNALDAFGEPGFCCEGTSR